MHLLRGRLQRVEAFIRAAMALVTTSRMHSIKTVVLLTSHLHCTKRLERHPRTLKSMRLPRLLVATATKTTRVTESVSVSGTPLRDDLERVINADR